jgi:hypothetical protein
MIMQFILDVCGMKQHFTDIFKYFCHIIRKILFCVQNLSQIKARLKRFFAIPEFQED